MFTLVDFHISNMATVITKREREREKKCRSNGDISMCGRQAAGDRLMIFAEEHDFRRPV